MTSICADIADSQVRLTEYVSKKKEEQGSPPPSYQELFPTALHHAPIAPAPGNFVPINTDSVVGNPSETASQDSIAAACDQKLDLGADYKPSMWYYEAGPNPIPYEIGRKISNPFTDNLRSCQTDGDKKKLKEVVSRIVDLTFNG